MDNYTVQAGTASAPGDDPVAGVATDVVLIPAPAAIPMRCPDGFSALLVTCVDIADGPELDQNGDVELLGGQWMTAVPQPGHANDGDVMLLLHEPSGPPMRAMRMPGSTSRCGCSTADAGSE